MLLLTCGSYALNIFRMDPFISSFLAISLSDTLFISRTLSARSSLTTILSHFFFHQLRCKMFASTSNVPCFTPFLFYAGCPFCRNPPHLSGLGTGIKKHRNVRPMVGLWFRLKQSLEIHCFSIDFKKVCVMCFFRSHFQCCL